MKTLLHLKQLSKDRKKSNKKLIQRLNKLKPKLVDQHFHEAHETVFEKIDCLDCANCCKTTSPIFTNRDVERIAHHLKMRPALFVEKYLNVDEDEDYVLKKSPCTFLGEDNYCSIYEVRPKACREYPHTNRKNIGAILDLSLKNTSICPAVFEVFEKIKQAGI